MDIVNPTRGRRVTSVLVALVALVCAGVGLVATPVRAADPSYVPLAAPARLLDTRADGLTVDGQFRGIGLRPAGGILELPVAGRAGVPAGTSSVVLNVTVVDARADGFVTVYPCGDRPTASNVNFVPGQTVANTVFARLTSSGTVCLFTFAPTDLVVDVAGSFPDASALVPLSTPARLLDTRPDGLTVDGAFVNIGAVQGGGVIELPISGRAGVPGGTATVVLNVTAASPQADGFVTVYPCGPRPTASNLNFARGHNVANAVVAKLTASGSVCLFAYATTDLVVDITGSFPTTNALSPLPTPARLLDTRPDGITVDGVYVNSGVRPSGGTIQLPIAGRAGVPASASAVILNVTSVDALAPGFVTAYPTGEARPTASNLNYLPGDIVPNAVVARLGGGGSICLFTYGATHLVVDVTAYLTGPPPPSTSAPCPGDPPPPPPPPVSLSAGTYIVGQTIQPGRYIARSARNGCYWERLSGFGGTFDEVIANDFQGFSGPNIVDVLPGDAGFEFDADCGRFETFAPAGPPASTISPGHHVVGVDILPGTYATAAAASCYWERLRSFSGNSSEIIANDFLSTAQTAIVTIAASDVGFFADQDCGIWSRM